MANIPKKLEGRGTTEEKEGTTRLVHMIPGGKKRGGKLRSVSVIHRRRVPEETSILATIQAGVT